MIQILDAVHTFEFVTFLRRVFIEQGHSVINIDQGVWPRALTAILLNSIVQLIQSIVSCTGPPADRSGSKALFDLHRRPHTSTVRSAKEAYIRLGHPRRVPYIMTRSVTHSATATSLFIKRTANSIHSFIVDVSKISCFAIVIKRQF